MCKAQVQQFQLLFAKILYVQLYCIFESILVWDRQKGLFAWVLFVERT